MIDRKEDEHLTVFFSDHAKGADINPPVGNLFRELGQCSGPIRQGYEKTIGHLSHALPTDRAQDVLIRRDRDFTT